MLWVKTASHFMSAVLPNLNLKATINHCVKKDSKPSLVYLHCVTWDFIFNYWVKRKTHLKNIHFFLSKSKQKL